MDSKDNAQEVQKRTLLSAAKKLLLSDMEALDSFADLQELPQDDQEGAFIRILAEHSEKVKNAAEGRTEDDGAQLEIILPDVDPKTNPNSPKFDPEAYKEAIDQAGGWQALNASLQEAVRDDFGHRTAALRAAGAEAAARIVKGAGVEAFEKLVRQAQDVARRYGEAIKQAAEAMEKIRPAMEEMARNNWPGYNDAPDVAKTISFGLAVLFAKAEAEGLDREGITLADVMENGFTDEWEPKPDSPYFDIAARAVEYAHVLLSAEEVEQIEQAMREAEETALIRAGQLTFEGLTLPIDKVTDKIKSGYYDEKGTYSGTINKMGGNVPDVKLIMSIDENLQKYVDRPLTARRLLILSAWYEMIVQGADAATIDDIIKWTGKRNINAADREAFRRDIDILAATNLRAEQDGFGSGKNKRPRFATGGKLLAYTYIETDAKGAAGGGLKYFFYKPPEEEEGGPLLTFAQRLNQVTFIPAAALATPSTKNEQTYNREDYFRTRIAHYLDANNKNKKEPIYCKILFETYFEKFNITDKKKRYQEKQYIFALLDYWQKINWIGGYVVEKDGITLRPPKSGGILPEKKPRRYPRIKE